MKTCAIYASAAVILTGCSFAPLIQSDSIDFGDTVDLVSNQLLVTNILRARDHAPLHFADLSALRAQFQLTGSAQAVLPFGEISRTGAVVASGTGTGSLATRASSTNILSLQTAPSFDFSPLDTQEFTRGILAPIDPQVVKYYFDRDLPQALLLFLLIDRVSPGPPSFPIPGAPGQQAAPGTPADRDYVNDPQHPDQFMRFAQWVQTVFGGNPDARVIVANSYLRQIGPAFGGSTATGGAISTEVKDITSIDTAKVRVECFDTAPQAPPGAPGAQGEKHCDDRTVQYKLVAYAQPPDVIFCAKERYFYVPLALVDKDVNDPQTAKFYEPESNLWKQLCTSPVAPGTTEAEIGTIYIRSVEGIMQYLGSLIEGRYAEQDQAALRQALGGYTLFDLSRTSAGARFGVTYEGQRYFVRPYDSATDRTMLTLALVTQLLNLNTKATELPTTRAVEIVP